MKGGEERFDGIAINAGFMGKDHLRQKRTKTKSLTLVQRSEKGCNGPINFAKLKEE
jgi:hypothetical protein